VTGEEGSANAEGTGAGDGLGDGEAVEGRRVGAVGEFGGERGELGDTGDPGVLLVQLCVDDLVLGLTDGGEDVGLASIVTVSTDTEVDLLVELVGLESLSDTKNGLYKDKSKPMSVTTIFLRIYTINREQLTSGGPWGTLDQVEAARTAATRAAPWRRAVCLLVARRVDSIMKKGYPIKARLTRKK
jgi:hypothetical protein